MGTSLGPWDTAPGTGSLVYEVRLENKQEPCDRAWRQVTRKVLCRVWKAGESWVGPGSPQGKWVDHEQNGDCRLGEGVTGFVVR